MTPRSLAFRSLLCATLLVGLLPLSAAADSPRDAFLGIEPMALTPELAEHLGARGGVLVGRVEPGSAADRAGLQVGDVLTEIDGRRVDDRRDLRRELRFYDAGETVRLEAVRDGERLQLSTELDASPSHRFRANGSIRIADGRHDVDIDVDVHELLEELGSLGQQIGVEVGAALADVDWEEIGDAVRQSLEGLEDLDRLDIEIRQIERDLERDLENLERDLEIELRQVERESGRSRV